MLRKGKGKRERQAVIYVSKIMSNAKNTEIGRYFGIQGSTVSEALKRVRFDPVPPQHGSCCRWLVLMMAGDKNSRKIIFQ
ncbi:MAG: hypothetical protein DWB57_14400 [Candidatus Brocadia sp.]|nr:hypothetical protein [Candidatus Brocadia sp.]